MGSKYRDLVSAHSQAKRSNRAVLNIMASWADNSGYVWMGNSKIAEETGLSLRTVIRCLRALTKAHEIELQEAGNGRGNVATYRIVVGQKGDTVTPKEAEKRVTNTTKKGDNVTIKGDNVTNDTSLYDHNDQYDRDRARARPVVRVKSPHLTPTHFQNGYIPANTGANAVEVYYERFDIRENAARLSAPQEDDLIRNCPDLDRLRDVVTAYSQRNDYRRGNLRLIFDWYRDGVPEYRNGNSNGTGPPTQRVNKGAGASLNANDAFFAKLQERISGTEKTTQHTGKAVGYLSAR